MIRGVSGCTMVNSAGVAFAEWQDEVTVLHAESDLDLDALVSWLSGWEPISP
jgi:hypothetical protein